MPTMPISESAGLDTQDERHERANKQNREDAALTCSGISTLHDMFSGDARRIQNAEPSGTITPLHHKPEGKSGREHASLIAVENRDQLALVRVSSDTTPAGSGQPSHRTQTSNQTSNWDGDFVSTRNQAQGQVPFHGDSSETRNPSTRTGSEGSSRGDEMFNLGPLQISDYDGASSLQDYC